MKPNRERLAQYFTTLCEIDSPSRHEGDVADFLEREFAKLQADSMEKDNSQENTGSDTGNLFVRYEGNKKKESALFFACHMDTVEPATGVKVVRKGDIFTSRGDTILGGDDKSGIAALLELITLLKENNAQHCPIELIFTTCEEIGLLGAKAMDPSKIQSNYGYALDSTKKSKIVTGAPAANRIKIEIFGKAAHSGSAPESGLNALAISATALSQIPLGRLDDISTSNIGLISGGTATNIIPDHIIMEGEVRSHSTELLQKHTEAIAAVFDKVVKNWPDSDDTGTIKPSFQMEVREDFPAMLLDENEPVLVRIKEAAARLDREIQFDIAGGGSDANIFNGHGLKTAIVPTGMAKVHTTEEEIDLNDMIELTELLYAMVTQ